MRSILGKAGSGGIVAALAICLGGCQPALSEKTANPSNPNGTTAANSVPANPVSAPAAAAEASDTTSKPEEGAAENDEKGSKVAVDMKSLEEILKEIAAEKGKWTVVDVWSTSCVPCMREFPFLVALSQKHPDKVRCVSVNVDYIGLKSKPPEKYLPNVEEFLKKQKAEFKNYLSTTADGDVFTELEIESIPAVIVFGPDGEKKKVFTDDNSGDDGVTYEGDILPYLDEVARLSQP